MTIDKWLVNAIKKLESTSVPSVQLDAEVLLADILGKDRTWLHAHPDHELQRSDLRKLDGWIKRRMSHEPIAYIRGTQEFYGREFVVSPDTLTPRPETETMIDLMLKSVDLKQFKENNRLQILDVGTGSGCILISVALEISEIKNNKSKISYIGLDLSDEALKIAKKNAKKLNADVKFKKFDLLTDSFTALAKPDLETIILANLPYVPNDFHINLAASHEPGFAIFGGKDGLDYYRLMFKKVTKQTKVIFTESLPPQHDELVNIATKAGYKLVSNVDLIHCFKK
jgi:release factor glutamine methyltransferase